MDFRLTLIKTILTVAVSVILGLILAVKTTGFAKMSRS